MIPPSWKLRRRIIYGTLFFCAGEVLYLTVWGSDTDLHSTIANGLILLAASVIGSYVFGAVWDDRNYMAMTKKTKDPEIPPEDYAG